MKLPELPVCRLPCGPGNQLQLTVMGEVLTEGLSDRGSTPLRSTKSEDELLALAQGGLRVMNKEEAAQPY